MTTLTVSQVNRYIKALIDESAQTRSMYVVGEISNFKHYNSGHMYFTLKDDTSQLKCVMFSSDNFKLKFVPQDGMSVLCSGQLSVYERDGVYQLYVHSMQPKGVGELAIAYEQLKEKLSKLGYFDDSLKKEIPKYPKVVGVATSNMGAAVEDIKNIISRRFPLCEILIAPTIVQGDNAPQDIAKSIAVLDDSNADVIIVGRGGGSIEDLWAFNSEIVANAIFNCKTPVISAVGHETDFTICDFVSDLRAPTPSAAAELAVPDVQNELRHIQSLSIELENLVTIYLDEKEKKLNDIKTTTPLANIDDLFNSQTIRINDLNQRINTYFSHMVDNSLTDIKRLASMINALSPLAVLSRGYSIVSKNGAVVKDVSDLNKHDLIDVRINNGTAVAEVCEVNKNE